jgi:hypothetical protein
VGSRDTTTAIFDGRYIVRNKLLDAAIMRREPYLVLHYTRIDENAWTARCRREGIRVMASQKITRERKGRRSVPERHSARLGGAVGVFGGRGASQIGCGKDPRKGCQKSLFWRPSHRYADSSCNCV